MISHLSDELDSAQNKILIADLENVEMTTTITKLEENNNNNTDKLQKEINSNYELSEQLRILMDEVETLRPLAAVVVVAESQLQRLKDKALESFEIRSQLKTEQVIVIIIIYIVVVINFNYFSSCCFQCNR